MDWLVVSGIFVAGWLMLSVLTGERMRRAQAIALALANAATEKARADSDVPVAAASNFAAPLPKGGPKAVGKPAH